ncbi:MAG: hypothetical protein ACLQU5_23270 [Isosphaeraceae bacterium]
MPRAIDVSSTPKRWTRIVGDSDMDSARAQAGNRNAVSLGPAQGRQREAGEVRGQGRETKQAGRKSGLLGQSES